MKKQSIIFLGAKSIGYQCLKYLIENAARLHLDIKGVLANEKAHIGSEFSLRELAMQNQIPFIESLDDMLSADFIYSVQYHLILRKKDIEKARITAVNLHMAPLPEYRGCNQFSFAIIDNKKEFGATVHLIDEKIDHGDILFEKRFPIPENCWVEQLYSLTFEASLKLFKESIDDLIGQKFTKVPQANLIEKRGTSLHLRSEIQNLKQIDFNWEQDKIARHIRATFMPGFEPPFTIIDNKKIYFCKEWK
ncbi:MAG TPA: formyltransferase family protein [Chitinophagaceae bacterium]|nr:formyltransferase family protein [Chitinophagaceae bacterium]